MFGTPEPDKCQKKRSQRTEENEECKIAYPNLLFDRNIIDGRAMMCSVLTLTIGNNQVLSLLPLRCCNLLSWP